MQTKDLRCRVRPMREADIPLVVEIERQSFSSMWPATVYRRELKNKLARYLVAYDPAAGAPSLPAAPPEAGPGLRGLLRRLFTSPAIEPPNRILGMVGLWCMMGEGHIVTIAVHEDARRLGIGEVLLVAILEAALESGQDEVTLEYRASNGAARSLYKKFGFSQVGVRAGYYSDNHEDAVLMTTPPLRSAPFRRLLSERIAAQRARWGAGYPLSNQLRMLEGVASRG